MKTIPQNLPDSQIIEALEKEIKKILRDFYIQILKQDSDIFNANYDALESALISGQVYFKDGKFYGKFNSKITKKFLELKGVFKNGSWTVPNLDGKYLSAIAQGNMIDTRRIEKILENLSVVQLKEVQFKAIYEKAVANLNRDIDKSFEKLPTVRAQFDADQLKNIADKYTTNLEKHIVGWKDEEVINLREKINKMVREGRRWENIAKEIDIKKAKTQSKANFIARQETRLLLSEMQEQKSLKAGIQKYKWVVRHDSKVRLDHEHLADTIQLWSDPPVINQKTGKRGHPGQDFNCRCHAVPVIE